MLLAGIIGGGSRLFDDSYAVIFFTAAFDRMIDLNKTTQLSDYLSLLADI